MCVHRVFGNLCMLNAARQNEKLLGEFRTSCEFVWNYIFNWNSVGFCETQNNIVLCWTTYTETQACFVVRWAIESVVTKIATRTGWFLSDSIRHIRRKHTNALVQWAKQCNKTAMTKGPTNKKQIHPHWAHLFHRLNWWNNIAFGFYRSRRASNED